ncbi:hypothetical protein ILUMI_24871 [Ignelater luminosus]|uniref:Uncharacterized protein n=1 Tax=Ignelater luminosus TaxID=2038154 RepID=A0A8K0CBN3_IGNLU|nr:hypothetical protein ILUMI_24871 [Ignelater luminosus]
MANPASVSASAISLPKTGNFSKCGSRFSGNYGLQRMFANFRCKRVEGVTNASRWPDSNANAFGKKLPPHRIFRNLFAREQRDDEPTDVFVSTARALLPQLPETPVLDETHKLNMIHGLLSFRIPELKTIRVFLKERRREEGTNQVTL